MCEQDNFVKNFQKLIQRLKKFWWVKVVIFYMVILTLKIFAALGLSFIGGYLP